MKLDRFTEKAQEAVLVAQRLASDAESPVLDAEGPTGVVTSGTMSPTLGTAIAMAYVAPAHAEPATMLDVEIREARVAAEVVPLPFYRRTA